MKWVIPLLFLSGCGMAMEDETRWTYCFAFCTYNYQGGIERNVDRDDDEDISGVPPPETTAE